MPDSDEERDLNHHHLYFQRHCTDGFGHVRERVVDHFPESQLDRVLTSRSNFSKNECAFENYCRYEPVFPQTKEAIGSPFLRPNWTTLWKNFYGSTSLTLSLNLIEQFS